MRNNNLILQTIALLADDADFLNSNLATRVVILYLLTASEFASDAPVSVESAISLIATETCVTQDEARAGLSKACICTFVTIDEELKFVSVCIEAVHDMLSPTSLGTGVIQ